MNKHELSKIGFELIGDASMRRLAKAFAVAMMVAFGAQAASAQTLKAVQDRGQLVCGANGVLAGFGMPDPQGNWTGFDVDYCRAMAAASSLRRLSSRLNSLSCVVMTARSLCWPTYQKFDDS